MIKKQSSQKNYIFDVSVEYCAAQDIKNKSVRKIQIEGNESLYKFAEIITKAYEKANFNLKIN